MVALVQTPHATDEHELLRQTVRQFVQNRVEPQAIPSLRAIYAQFFQAIWRTLRRLGVPQAQLDETLSKHFAGQADLLIIAFEIESFGAALKWEPSRGGQLFPHLYAPLPVSAAVELKTLPVAPAQPGE